MSLFQRVFNYMVSEVIVGKLSDSRTFQRFAVRSTHMAQDASKKVADLPTSVKSSVAKTPVATQVRSELDVVRARLAEAKAEFVTSVKDVADKLNK